VVIIIFIEYFYLLILAFKDMILLLEGIDQMKPDFFAQASRR
jgi:hypothetical protein